MSSGHNHALGSHTRSAQFRLALSMLITLIFVGVEAVAGYWAQSLALVTDAAHNLSDVMALGLSWFALRLSTQPSHSGKTFGYHRAGILAALVNSTVLALIAFGVLYEAYERLLTPADVQENLLMIVGGAALVVNLVTAWLVSHGSQHDLNLRSAFVHLLGDVFSTAGAMLAGVGIWLTGFDWLDPAASVLIGLLILWNVWAIIRETVEILLEGTPRDIDMSIMVRDLLKVDGVRGVHDLHVWSISKSLRVLSAHILVDDMPISAAALILSEVKGVIGGRYGIAHAVLQLECVGCDPDHLYCDIAGTGRALHRH